MVIPRGGGGDGLDNDDDGHLEDDINDTEIDESEEYDIIEDGDVGDEEDGESLDSTSLDDDDASFSPSKFSFFSSSSSSSLTSTMMHYANILIRVTKRACVAGARAVLHNDEEDDHGRLDNNKAVVHTLLGRTAYVLGEMYHAALTPEDYGEESVVETTLRIGQDNDDDDDDRRGKHNKRRSRKRRKHTHKRKKKQHEHTTNPTTILCNGGGIDDEHAILDLAKQYNINLPTNNEHNQLSKKYTNTILLSSQTSLNDALQLANSNARFLLCYISKQSNRKNNEIVIPNLLSQNVIKMANRKPLGKKQTGNTASYYIWITNNDKDVELAMKRLKVKLPSKKSNSKSTGAQSSILTIIYPSTTIDPTSSKLKVSPRLLTQHHCNPPPSTSDSFIQWMNTIRKRHLKEYNKLQYTVREMELLKERNEGYVTSINEDKEREQKEAIEKQRKKDEEIKEHERLQGIIARREELLASMVDEPPMGSEGLVTIALRFTDGTTRDRTTLQRRFDSKSTTTNDVCNWIDAVHGIERERLELSTMNGSKKFVYVDDDDDGEEKNVMTLEEAGLGKMTALRVSEIVVNDDDNAEEEGEEASGEEEESEYEDESGEE